MYWLLWLAFGIGFTALFSASAIPTLIPVTFVRDYTRKSKYLRAALFSLVVAFAFSAFVWTVATAFALYKEKLPVGPAEINYANIKNLYLAPLISFLGSLFICFGAIVAMREKLFVKPLPERKIRRKIPKDHDTVLRLVGDGLLLLGIIAATVILSMLFVYVMLKLFTLSRAKKLLVLLIGFELCAVALFLFIKRKKIPYFRAIVAAGSAVCFALLVSGFFVLLYVSRETVEKILLFGGSGVAIIIPGTIIAALMLRRSRLREPDKEEDKPKKFTIIKQKESV